MGKESLKNWITNGTGKPFYARKTFTLSAPVKSAAVTICGLGQFNLYINGTKVGDHVLDPAWTDYSKYIQYVEFDVSDMLVEGENVIAAEVGNGWYLMDTDDGNYVFHFPPFMPPNPNPYIPYGKMLVLNAALEADLADGSKTEVITDDSWKVKEHMVEVTNTFGSETINGAKRVGDWNQIAADESGWEAAQIVSADDAPQAPLTKQVMPPVKVIRTYDAREIGAVDGRLIYDFSQNASGMLSFDVKGKKGDVIKVYPAEKLDANGDVDQMAKNWVMIDVLETYTIAEDDTWEHFEMTFTYFCARFIGVTGCSSDQIKNIKLNVISSAGGKAGTFECDDPRFMQIYDLIEKAVEANMVSVHTDCPTIERFAWQEENHLMAPTCMYMKPVKSHWEKFLTDTRVAQHTADDWFNDMAGGKFYPGDGLIPAQAPCYMPNVLPVPGLGDFYNIIGWGSTIIIGTNWHYEFYGDTSIIEANYEAGRKYLEHLKTRVNEDGFINHGLGDWGNPAGMFAKDNVETAFLYADAKLLEKFANILGKAEDAKEFAAYAEEIKANYNEKLLVFNEADGRYCYKVWDQKDAIVTTPATQAFPLFWGLCPEDKEADIVAELKKCVEAGNSFQSGEVGQPYIIQTLSKYDMNDLICKCILSEQHPSYYAFVLAGETTLGEYWEDNPRSHCHDMMGHIAEWYYNGLAGIKPIEPGFKKVLIKPYLPESIHTMKCSYDSASGPITVSMKRNGDEIALEVEAADGIEVTIDRTYLS